MSSRLERYVSRIRTEIGASLTGDYTPHQVASSFAIGTFITMLPTLGTGLFLFAVLVYLFKWINKIALFVTVIIFNPFVKSGVWVLSLAIGLVVLGPVEGFAIGDVPTFSDGTAIVIRLLFGSLVLAIIATVIAYVVMYRIVVAYNRKQLPILEETVEHVVEEIEKREPRVEGEE